METLILSELKCWAPYLQKVLIYESRLSLDFARRTIIGALNILLRGRLIPLEVYVEELFHAEENILLILSELLAQYFLITRLLELFLESDELISVVCG